MMTPHQKLIWESRDTLRSAQRMISEPDLPTLEARRIYGDGRMRHTLIKQARAILATAQHHGLTTAQPIRYVRHSGGISALGLSGLHRHDRLRLAYLFGARLPGNHPVLTRQS